jgi:hypothetical protein
VEATPVLRNVVNHAYALRWLVDNGPLAVDALIAKDHGGLVDLQEPGAGRLARRGRVPPFARGAEGSAHSRLQRRRRATAPQAQARTWKRLRHAQPLRLRRGLLRLLPPVGHVAHQHRDGQRLPGVDGRRDLRDPRRGCGPWALVDLAEAAAGGNGNRDAARRRCAELIPEAATTGSPLLRASVALAAPMLATEDAQALFDAAFDADLAGHCTVLGCSSHRACGCGAASRLATLARRCAPRGTPSTRSAPRPGQNARAGSSAQPASAAISDHRRPGRAGPQELQIARLAAEGLRNREIG